MPDSLNLIQAKDVATIQLNATGGTAVIVGKNNDTYVVGLPPAILNTLVIDTLAKIGIEGTLING